MKTFLIILVCVVFSSKILPQSDYNNFKHYYGGQINTGVTFFDLQPLKDDFTYTIERFNQDYNIPLEIQHLYPANISWSGYLFWYISPRASVIIGPEYTSTRAYSMYEDYAGTLDIKSEIKLYYLYLGFRVHIIETPIIQPLIGVNIGLARTDYKVDVELNINNGQIVDDQHSEITDTGYSIEPYLGCTYDLKYVVLELITAYKMVYLDNLLIAPDNLNIKLGVKVGIFK